MDWSDMGLPACLRERARWTAVHVCEAILEWLNCTRKTATGYKKHRSPSTFPSVSIFMCVL